MFDGAAASLPFWGFPLSLGVGMGVIFEYKSLESDYQEASKIIKKDV
jgi:hypothetical protein